MPHTRATRLPSESQLRPPASVEGTAMNTRTLTLAVSVFLTIIILTTISAQAWSPMDLFRSDRAQAKTETYSLGEMDALMSSGKSDAELPNLTAHAVTAVNSPVGGVGKTLRRSYFVQVSGYSSEVAQTDASPFIMANGNHVRWGAVAANIIDASGRNIPFGTVIKIPSLYGNQLFVVEDRLNKRYTKNVDIWFEHKADAVKLGRRNVMIEVIQ